MNFLFCYVNSNIHTSTPNKDMVNRIISTKWLYTVGPDKNMTLFHREYDEYGFKVIPDYEVEDMKLLAKIQALEIRSHNLLQQEKGDRSLLARWTQFLGGRSPDDLSSSEELKTLVRAGVPRQYRPCVWRWMVRVRTNTLRQRHPDLFQQLCEKSRATPHPAARQIQLDLHRTLTTNQSFSSPSSPMLQQLQRILLAFSWQNPEVGYCQGLNRYINRTCTQHNTVWAFLKI